MVMTEEQDLEQIAEDIQELQGLLDIVLRARESIGKMIDRMGIEEDNPRQIAREQSSNDLRRKRIISRGKNNPHHRR